MRPTGLLWLGLHLVRLLLGVLLVQLETTVVVFLRVVEAARTAAEAVVKLLFDVALLHLFDLVVHSLQAIASGLKVCFDLLVVLIHAMREFLVGLAVGRVAVVGERALSIGSLLRQTIVGEHTDVEWLFILDNRIHLTESGLS